MSAFSTVRSTAITPPTLDEGPLQRAILAALNSARGQRDSLIRQVTGAMEQEIAPILGESMSLVDIEKRLEEINQQVGNLVALATKENDIIAYQEQLKDLVDETTFLKEKRDFIQMQREKDYATAGRIEIVVTTLNQAPAELQWDESIIRQLVDTVKVISKEKIIVYLRNGMQIEQKISE